MSFSIELWKYETFEVFCSKFRDNKHDFFKYVNSEQANRP